MKNFTKIILICLGTLSININASADEPIRNGDGRFALYLPQLENKRVAVFANSASRIDGQNIIEALLSRKINVVKIFTPEHGFSGLDDAGAAVTNSQENQTHIPIVSLYGAKTKPNKSDLIDVDIIVFDIQDVGVRYYTYISSLQKLMEAATINNKPLIILDRANPNGYYIDGPVLESSARFKSFVGLQPIPIVYGMTIGEYAKMLKGEHWLELKPKAMANKLKLTVIPLENYTHQSKYQLEARPSPNLPNMTAIYWYPSLGWFEGTKLSIGRGTPMPFQVIGSPYYSDLKFSFTPESTIGALNPPLKGQLCYGWDLRMGPQQALQATNGTIQLKYLIQAYQLYPDKANFFTPFFTKLAGTDNLKQQIVAGNSESQIRASWQPALDHFKQIRKKYLLYPDF